MTWAALLAFTLLSATDLPEKLQVVLEASQTQLAQAAAAPQKLLLVRLDQWSAQAVGVEDYDTAAAIKKYKEALASDGVLPSTEDLGLSEKVLGEIKQYEQEVTNLAVAERARLFAKLEEQKRAAVASEDFETASAIRDFVADNEESIDFLVASSSPANPPPAAAPTPDPIEGIFEVEWSIGSSQKGINKYRFNPSGLITRQGRVLGNWQKERGRYAITFDDPNKGTASIQLSTSGKMSGTQTSPSGRTRWVGKKIWPIELNTVETRQGWKPLFDGVDFEGWHAYRNGSMRPQWSVDEGDIVGLGRGSDLVTDTSYGDFELSLDYNLGAGGNSGVFVRVPEVADEPFEECIELQILDGIGKTSQANGNSSIYGLYPPARYAAKPTGEWNNLRIIAKKSRVTYILNGVLIHDIDTSTAEFKQRYLAKPSHRLRESFATATEGKICLQAPAAGTIVFRNIKIRPL